VFRTPASRLSLALVITLGFVFVEAAAGRAANSLSLLTDAAHNLTDAMALGLSWIAARLSASPPSSRRTYGLHRAGILAALINSATLLLVAGFIFIEAYRRLLSPPPVQSVMLIVVGLVAVMVNLSTALIVRPAGRRDLNLRSAFVHLMGDVLSTLGAVGAGIGILLTGKTWLDPLVSVFMGALILVNAWKIVRESSEILLESTPPDVAVEAMVEDILGVEGVRGVHDLHVWSLTGSLRSMSAHILTEDLRLSAGAKIQQRINELVHVRYGIGHATLQLECDACEPDDLFHDWHETTAG
jgi:cobalt-zinc-cadmium efflux system protein